MNFALSSPIHNFNYHSSHKNSIAKLYIKKFNLKSYVTQYTILIIIPYIKQFYLNILFTNELYIIISNIQFQLSFLTPNNSIQIYCY